MKQFEKRHNSWAGRRPLLRRHPVRFSALSQRSRRKIDGTNIFERDFRRRNIKNN
jgi:hypothetical protein